MTLGGHSLRSAVMISTLALFLLGADMPASKARPAFHCPPIAPMPRAMAIEGRYAGPSVDPSFSTLDPAKVEQQVPERSKFSRPVTRINMLSAQYLSASDEGSRKAISDCLARHFAALPAAQAMEGADSDADQYYRDWMVSSLAMSYLRAKAALDGSSDAPTIHAWFARMAAQIRSFYELRTRQRGLDNHVYWGAAAVSAIGRVNDDPAALAYGRSILVGALDGVDPDGIMAAEVKRGAKSRHYHIFSIVPLAAIAILTRTDAEAAGNGGFQRLTHRLVADFEDPSGGLIARRSGKAQEAESPGQLAIVVPLIKGDAALAARLKTLTTGQRSDSYPLGGDIGFLTGLAARP